jgi:hypothetical protein
VLSCFCLVRLINGLRAGALDVPLRGANWLVTDEHPILFVLLALAYLLAAGLFAWISVSFARQRTLIR